jgi:arylsulfatase A-like enzyme
MDAHMPWSSPPSFNAKFSGRNPPFSQSEENALFAGVNDLEKHLDSVERSHLFSRYDAGIAYIESEIGRLLVRLRELGLYEDTLIIITSDYGEAFDEHDLMGHSTGHEIPWLCAMIRGVH